jgi:hypothetical protein
METKRLGFNHSFLFHIYFILPADPPGGRFPLSVPNLSLKPPETGMNCTPIPIPGVPCVPMETRGLNRVPIFFIPYIVCSFSQILRHRDPGLFPWDPCRKSRGKMDGTLPVIRSGGALRSNGNKGVGGPLFRRPGRGPQAYPSSPRNSSMRLRAVPRFSRETA